MTYFPFFHFFKDFLVTVLGNIINIKILDTIKISRMQKF